VASKETGRAGQQPSSSPRRDETGACGNAGYETFAGEQGAVVVPCRAAARRPAVCDRRRLRPDQGWTVFRSTSGRDGVWFTVRAGAILSRQIAHVQLGSDQAGWSGRFWFGLRQVKARFAEPITSPRRPVVDSSGLRRPPWSLSLQALIGQRPTPVRPAHSCCRRRATEQQRDADSQRHFGSIS